MSSGHDLHLLKVQRFVVYNLQNMRLKILIKPLGVSMSAVQMTKYAARQA